MFSGTMLAVEVCKDRRSSQLRAALPLPCPAAWLARSSSSVDKQKSAKSFTEVPMIHDTGVLTNLPHTRIKNDNYGLPVAPCCRRQR